MQKTRPLSCSALNKQLKWESGLFAVKVVALIPLTQILLRVFGYRRTLALFHWVTPDKKNNLKLENPEKVELFIQRSRYHLRKLRRYKILPGNCLSRSLSMWWLLKLKGIESTLQIGTGIQFSSFNAHAWLEVHGRPFNAGKRVRQKYCAFEEEMVSISAWN